MLMIDCGYSTCEFMTNMCEKMWKIFEWMQMTKEENWSLWEAYAFSSICAPALFTSINFKQILYQNSIHHELFYFINYVHMLMTHKQHHESLAFAFNITI
jgi:hypothetical protein